MGAVAFKIDSNDAVRSRAAKAKSKNGSAELKKASFRKCRHWPAIGKFLPSHFPTIHKKHAANKTRKKINQTGPKTGTAIRMNRNEAPHMAESKSSRAKPEAFIRLAILSEVGKGNWRFACVPSRNRNCDRATGPVLCWARSDATRTRPTRPMMRVRAPHGDALGLN